MGDYINDIKTIIFNFLENEYKSYLNENKILCIKENKLNEIIKDLYNNNTKNIKNIIRNTMKNKYKDNYKSASIEQIILDIFQDKDNNIQVIVNEINFIQNKNLYIIDFPIINNSLNLNISNSDGYIIINNVKKIDKNIEEIYNKIEKYKFIYSINDKILDDYDSANKINIIKEEIKDKTEIKLGIYYLKNSS